MKIKVAVPNSRTSSTSKALAISESESKRSEDERSTEEVVSSPVIKVYGSLERIVALATTVGATAVELTVGETTEVVGAVAVDSLPIPSCVYR